MICCSEACWTIRSSGGGASSDALRSHKAKTAVTTLGHEAVKDKVHMHDLHATILHLLGVDHERLTYRFAGRDFRLTDVHGRVVHEILV